MLVITVFSPVFFFAPWPLISFHILSGVFSEIYSEENIYRVTFHQKQLFGIRNIIFTTQKMEQNKLLQGKVIKAILFGLVVVFCLLCFMYYVTCHMSVLESAS